MFVFKKRYFIFFLIWLAMIVSQQPFINFLFYFLFVSCIYSGLKYNFILNPYFLLSVTPFSLLFYNVNYSNYLFSISLSGYLIIFFGILSFFSGFKYFEISRYRLKNKSIIYSNKIDNRIFWIILILGLIPHFIGFLRVGIPLFSLDDLNESRINYLPSGVSYFIFFLPLTVIIGFINRNKKMIIFSIMINSFVCLIRVSKFDIFVFSIFLLFSIIKYGDFKFSSFKKYFFFGLFVVFIPILFNWIYSLRNSDMVEISYFDLNIGFFTDSVSSIISLPYLYLTSAWSNFAYNLEIVSDYNYGFYTFYPFISALQLDGLVIPISIKTIYLHPFNTFAFLTDYYMDFGILGILVLPFIVGYIVFYSFIKSLYSSNFIYDGQFLVFAISTFLLFFSNHFTTVGYPFIVFIIYGFVGNILKFAFYSK